MTPVFDIDKSELAPMQVADDEDFPLFDMSAAVETKTTKKKK